MFSCTHSFFLRMFLRYQENCPRPRKFPPMKILPPEKITPNEIPSPFINHTNERKNKITKFFALKKAVQYNILIKITKVLFDTQMISQKILGLDTFFTEWKKSKNRTKAKIAKWHLHAICTTQGELKLGSQIIKFGKYVKLLNSQLSMHSTLWILKKANSKMHALGRSVAIVYECGCVLAAHVSIMYTLQICLIRTNLKALAPFSCLFICFL